MGAPLSGCAITTRVSTVAPRRKVDGWSTNDASPPSKRALASACDAAIGGWPWPFCGCARAPPTSC
eukprot:6885960-Prymnesium_polylepis.1